MSKNYFRYIFWAGFAVWFIGSWVGNWNRFAETTLEGYTDFIGGLLLAYGGLGDVLRNMTINKTYEGDTFNNKHFNYIDKRPNGENSFTDTPTKVKPGAT